MKGKRRGGRGKGEEEGRKGVKGKRRGGRGKGEEEGREG